MSRAKKPCSASARDPPVGLAHEEPVVAVDGDRRRARPGSGSVTSDVSAPRDRRTLRPAATPAGRPRAARSGRRRARTNATLMVTSAANSDGADRDAPGRSPAASARDAARVGEEHDRGAAGAVPPTPHAVAPPGRRAAARRRAASTTATDQPPGRQRGESPAERIPPRVRLDDRCTSCHAGCRRPAAPPPGHERAGPGAGDTRRGRH